MGLVGGAKHSNLYQLSGIVFQSLLGHSTLEVRRYSLLLHCADQTLEVGESIMSNPHPQSTG